MSGDISERALTVRRLIRAKNAAEITGEQPSWYNTQNQEKEIDQIGRHIDIGAITNYQPIPSSHSQQSVVHVATCG